MFAGPGAGVLWAAGGEPDAAEQRRRPRLVGLVTAALVDICPALAEAGQGTSSSTPISASTCRARGPRRLSVALRARAKEFVFDNETVFLDEGMRPRFAAELRVYRSRRPSQGRQRQRGGTIDFRRQCAARRCWPARMPGSSQRIAGAPVALGELGREMDRPIDAIEETLRRLEAAGIVRLDMAGG